MAKLLYALTHIPQVVLPLFNSLGSWTYVILFSLIFMETGLVVFPLAAGTVADFCHVFVCCFARCRGQDEHFSTRLFYRGRAGRHA